ncbi:MAG: helix-turn-helix domain-containing protein [Gemmatimonadales bacterium]
MEDPAYERPRNPEACRRAIARRLRQQRASREPPPDEETLRQVRKLRRLSQAEVARQLETSQSEISRLEQRADLRVSTLAAYVKALGGSLELWARFPGLLIRLRLTVHSRRCPPPRP